MKRKFTKLIAAFALLAFLIPMTGWGQTWEKTAPEDLTTDDIIVVVDLTSGKAMSNNNGTSSGPSAIDVTLNTTNDQIIGEVGEIIRWSLTTSGSGASRTYQLANGTNYLYVTKNNNGVRVGTGARNTFTIVTGGDNNGYYLYNYDETNEDARYVGCYNNSDWRCYNSINNYIKTNNIAFFKKITGGSTSVATTITINDSGITNTDVSISTAAGSLSATVTETESGNPVSGATVTWISSDQSVAFIDAEGVVTLVAAGTTAITAFYAGVSGEYGASSATYVLTVTSSAPYVQPTEFEIGLNNALFGTEYNGTAGGITDANPLVGTQDNVTVTYAGGGSHYVNNELIRFYPNNKLTFEAPDGYEIKKIVFTADGQWDATISANGGTYNSGTKTWTGSATSVLFTGSGSGHCRMSQAAITLGLPSSVATPVFTPASGTSFGNEGLDVTITCTTEGASIHYTLDGTEPTSESTAYSEAIHLTTTTTVKAIAYVGSEASSVATATYNYVVEYATLPFVFVGNEPVPVNGITMSGVGSYSSSPYIKFDNKNDYVVLKLNEAPTSLSYDLRGYSFSEGVFVVEVSADGINYTTLATYTELGATQTITHIDFAADVRYIKWVYTEKVNGNVALGNIKASANYDIYSDVTVASLTIPADKVCTVYSPATLNVTNALTNEATTEAWNNLIIKDGAQLKTPNAVKGTIEKFVAGYGESTNGKYVLLATPATMDACNSTGMWPSETAQHVNVDFYAFDQSFAGAEWRNYKYGYDVFAEPIAMTQGTGYLYANKNDVTLTLETRGFVAPNIAWEDYPFAPTNVNQNVTLEYSDGKPFAGYNLIGNPFTCDAYINRDYYRMNPAGDAIVPAAAATTAIKPCEGIFVKAADASDNSVTFTTTAPSTSSAPANVVINLKDSEVVRDRAIVCFDGERDMPRFQFNDAAAKLYIPQGEKEMAKVGSEAQGEMPVNFVADKNGSFTLNVDAANLDVDYLHLIDNKTGADIDLLQTPSYTFDARTTDYASRFRLVFSVNNVPESEDSHSAFAYFNGSEWVINASDNATVQVVDVMGRVILNSDAKHGVSTANMPAGVYMLRLVNGNNVKVQKIVVR